MFCFSNLFTSIMFVTIKSMSSILHAFPSLHPFLALLWVRCVLIKAALLDLPLAVYAFGGIVSHRHLLLLVLSWVERLRLPLHKSVLRHELDPLSGSVGPTSAHAVVILVAVAYRDLGLL